MEELVAEQLYPQATAEAACDAAGLAAEVKTDEARARDDLDKLASRTEGLTRAQAKEYLLALNYPEDVIDNVLDAAGYAEEETDTLENASKALEAFERDYTGKKAWTDGALYLMDLGYSRPIALAAVEAAGLTDEAEDENPPELTDAAKAAIGVTEFMRDYTGDSARTDCLAYLTGTLGLPEQAATEAVDAAGLIDEADKPVEPTEEERAAKALEEFAATYEGSKIKTDAKQFLLAEGFSEDVADKAIEDAGLEDEPDGPQKTEAERAAELLAAWIPSYEGNKAYSDAVSYLTGNGVSEDVAKAAAEAAGLADEGDPVTDPTDEERADALIKEFLDSYDGEKTASNAVSYLVDAGIPEDIARAAAERAGLTDGDNGDNGEDGKNNGGNGNGDDENMAETGNDGNAGDENISGDGTPAGSASDDSINKTGDEAPVLPWALAGLGAIIAAAGAKLRRRSDQ